MEHKTDTASSHKGYDTLQQLACDDAALSPLAAYFILDAHLSVFRVPVERAYFLWKEHCQEAKQLRQTEHFQEIDNETRQALFLLLSLLLLARNQTPTIPLVTNHEEGCNVLLSHLFPQKYRCTSYALYVFALAQEIPIPRLHLELDHNHLFHQLMTEEGMMFCDWNEAGHVDLVVSNTPLAANLLRYPLDLDLHIKVDVQERIAKHLMLQTSQEKVPAISYSTQLATHGQHYELWMLLNHISCTQRYHVRLHSLRLLQLVCDKHSVDMVQAGLTFLLHEDSLLETFTNVHAKEDVSKPHVSIVSQYEDLHIQLHTALHSRPVLFEFLVQPLVTRFADPELLTAHILMRLYPNEARLMKQHQMLHAYLLQLFTHVNYERACVLVHADGSVQVRAEDTLREPETFTFRAVELYDATVQVCRNDVILCAKTRVFPTFLLGSYAYIQYLAPKPRNVLVLMTRAHPGSPVSAPADTMSLQTLVSSTDQGIPLHSLRPVPHAPRYVDRTQTHRFGLRHDLD